MPYTEADLTAIRAARLSPTRTVQFADRSITYKSDAEMKAVEDAIVRELNASTARPNKQFYGVSDKGF